MNQESINQVQSILTIMIGVVVIILLPTFVGIAWSVFSSNKKTLQANTHAIIKLETKIDLLFPHLSKMPKMETDMNYLHDKVRVHDKKLEALSS